MLTLPAEGHPRPCDSRSQGNDEQIRSDAFDRVWCVRRYGPPGFGPGRNLGRPWLRQRRLGRGVWVFRHDRLADLSIYEETATITSSSTFTSGSLFDVGVGVRVFRNLTVGAAYHQEQNDTEGHRDGIDSEPGLLQPSAHADQAGSRPRSQGTGDAPAISVGSCRSARKLDVLVYGGPSFFRLTQEVVSDVVLNEQGGAFTIVATFRRHERKKSQTGYNVGADATYILWQNDSIRLGAGGFVRFTQASTDIDMLNTPQPTEVGGMQFGFGARLRF